MPFTVTMPKLSPTMETGTLAKWRKKEGDFVKAGEVLVEVATDKATLEYAALDDGYLRKILIPEGGDAVVNQAIAVFTENKTESIEGYKPEGLVPAVAAVASHQVTSEAGVSSQPKTSTSTGPAMAQPEFKPEPPLTNYQFPFKRQEKAKAGVKATPLAKKIAKDKGLDISALKGSGSHGQILAEDLAHAPVNVYATLGLLPSEDVAPGSYEEIAMSPMRKVIAQRLQQSKTFVPHFYVSIDVRVDALEVIRAQLHEGGVKVSINDFIFRATALALRKHPEMNCGFNTVTQSIIQFKTVDISCAVSVEGGLITPIVRYCDRKNVFEISTEIKTLAAKAKSNQLAREEYVGGSFTISNLGMFGISEFQAIVNPPQAVILAVAAAEEKPVVDDGLIKIGKVMRLSTSADHRVVDGIHCAKFLSTLKSYLEKPALLLMN